MKLLVFKCSVCGSYHYSSLSETMLCKNCNVERPYIRESVDIEYPTITLLSGKTLPNHNSELELKFDLQSGYSDGITVIVKYNKYSFKSECILDNITELHYLYDKDSVAFESDILKSGSSECIGYIEEIVLIKRNTLL